MKKHIFALFVTALGFQAIWENAQAPLFIGYSSFWQHFLICLRGTIGDIAITLFVFTLFGFLKKDFLWIAKLNALDAIMLAVIGFSIATAIEWRALLLERWAYTPAMPIIPYIKVGLTPILQMTLLLPLTMYIAKKLTKFS